MGGCNSVLASIARIDMQIKMSILIAAWELTMPIYEYECQKCGVMEIEQRITADRLLKCPKCKSKKFEKLISLSAFHLKGSGWYTTDYARKDEKGGEAESKSSDTSDSTDKSVDSNKKADSKSSDSKKSENKSETKSDSKPDTKSKAKSSGGASASA